MLGVFGCAKESFITPGEFTAEYAMQLRKAAPQYTVSILRDFELEVRDSAGNKGTVYLDNCYAEYKSSPKNKEAIISRFTSAFVEGAFKTSQFDPKRIIPVIKDVRWLSEIRESFRAKGNKELEETVCEPLNNELVIIYAEDDPKKLRYISPKDIEGTGLKREELRRLAVKNLKAILPDIEVRSGNGVFMISAGGNYEASLLLADGFWREKKIAVDGDYVVAIPARGLLLVAGSNDKAAILRIREFSNRAIKDAPYPLTSDLFVYRAGRFTKYKE